MYRTGSRNNPCRARGAFWSQQISSRGVPGKRFGDLAGQPGLCGIWGDIEMDDFSSFVTEDDQAVEKLKRRGRYNEHVDGHGVAHVVVQEAAPRRGGGFGPPRHVSTDRGLADNDAKLEQLAMDTRCTPKRICRAHFADQITDLMAHPGPPQMA